MTQHTIPVLSGRGREEVATYLSEHQQEQQGCEMVLHRVVAQATSPAKLEGKATPEFSLHPPGPTLSS